MQRASSRKVPILYTRIELELRREIEEGMYAIGQCLPGEHALCERFGVSRFTIRQAIRKLGDDGLVGARPGVGTVVIATRRRDAFVQTLNSVEELLQYPPGTTRHHLEVRQIEADAALALLLQCAAGSRWFWLRAMRILSRTQRPISWLDAYVAPAFADVLALGDQTGAPLLKLIEDVHGHRAAQSQVAISAGRISDEQAAPLLAAPDSPALVIMRRYRGQDGETYLVTHSTHPEDRFSLNFEFEKR